MRALKVKARVRAKSSIGIYLRKNFNIGIWEFIWGTQSFDVQDVIDDKAILAISGGFLGKDNNMIVKNPLQLIVAIVAGSACTVECGYGKNAINIKFSKRDIKKVKIHFAMEYQTEEVEYEGINEGAKEIGDADPNETKSTIQDEEFKELRNVWHKKMK